MATNPNWIKAELTLKGSKEPLVEMQLPAIPDIGQEIVIDNKWVKTNYKVNKVYWLVDTKSKALGIRVILVGGPNNPTKAVQRRGT